jgi:hypothetical protein
MAQEFQLEAVTAILALGDQQLTKIEIIVLKALQAAALGDIYWDTMGRLRANLRDLPVILRNIKFKAQRAGIEPALNALKEKHANVLETCS